MRFSFVNYRNGKDVLPTELLKELQKYIQGELIYIPKQNEGRAAWGEMNGTRVLIDKRNREIYRLYKTGTDIDSLVEAYNLSEDSIRKIIFKTRRQLESISI